MITTILFDFDDTICNTNECVEGALEYSFIELKKKYPNITLQEYIYANTVAFHDLFYENKIPVYRASSVIWFRIMDKLGLDHDYVLIHKLQLKFNKYIRDNIQLNEGVKELMMFLKKKQLKIGILSNGLFNEKMEKYRKLRLHKFNIKIVASDIIGFEKPDPRAFEEILQKVDAVSTEVMFIGDTPNTDVIGSKNLNMIAVLFKTKGKSYSQSDLSIADYNISNHAEVIDILNKVNSY